MSVRKSYTEVELLRRGLMIGLERFTCTLQNDSQGEAALKETAADRENTTKSISE